ncbi:MAG: ornithine carbamoyltransferase [Opitutales bacterium]
MTKHFLTDTDFNVTQVSQIFQLARRLKGNRHSSEVKPLEGQSWGMIFFKNSTRTRISFEVGIYELGGNAVVLSADQMQIGRGETIADTAKVISRYLDGVVVRCFDHAVLEELAEHGTIPVINALSDFLHPCQTYTDYFTLAERWAKGPQDLVTSLKGRKIVFFGDCASNMAYSITLTGLLLGLEVVLSGPEDFKPGKELDDAIAKAGLPTYTFTTDAEEAARGADVLYADVFVSMGDEAEKDARMAAMMPYQVNMELLKKAKKDAYFLHCLPAHAGEEVSQEVLDHPASIIFDQAENRLHVQKAIMAKLSEAYK